MMVLVLTPRAKLDQKKHSVRRQLQHKQCLCRKTTIMEQTVSIFSATMILWIFFLSTAFSYPSKEVSNLLQESENHKDVTLKYIVPGISALRAEDPTKIYLSDILDQNDENYRSFMEHVEKGHTHKGLTFNIYDDNLRGATIYLYKMLHMVKDKEQFDRVNDWLRQNINSEMYDYALRLFSLFNTKLKIIDIDPPFKTNPYHFVNSETIIKALKLSTNMEHIHHLDYVGNQIVKREQLILINSNYSGWNLPHNDCKGKIDYFTEDISLNSYYYGINLLHPFWMSNEELDEHNPRHAEHYYFAHRQLLSRYYLEEAHLIQTDTHQSVACKSDYIPYLIHKNGLPFPIRTRIKKEFNDQKARLVSTDLAIKELIGRAMIIMDNGTSIKLNEDNYIDLIAKLVRANFDSNRVAKTVRSLFGFGYDGYPIDEYNPSPSLMHHPETTLRDPAFWNVLQVMLDYFTDFGKTLKPLDMSQHETEEVRIVDASFSKLMTYFDYYTFDINKAVESDILYHAKPVPKAAARQKRLKHFPIVFNFTVESEYDKNIIMRLFIGPRCDFVNCWKYLYKDFHELDTKLYHLNEGLNFLSWTSERSPRFSFDDHFDMEHQFLNSNKNYSMFKFPENLLLPHGLEHGLNLSLFIMLTPPEDRTQMDFNLVGSNQYVEVSYDLDKKPLGFPFHRIAVNCSSEATNYKFYDITVFHKKRPVDGTGYFSPHLY